MMPPILPVDIITSTGNGERETGNGLKAISKPTATPDCDTDTDPERAVRSASSGSHNQVSGFSGEKLLLQRGTGNGQRIESDIETDRDSRLRY
jgi:hypothetical protein